MPLIQGPINREGAVVDVFVGVSHNRKKVLKKSKFPIPEQIAVRAIIDTGSNVSAFMPNVFKHLGLTRIDEVPIRSASTKRGQEHLSDLHDVSVALVSGVTQHVIPSLLVIVSEDFDEDPDTAQALIGRDVLDRCTFMYYGKEQQFTLGF